MSINTSSNFLVSAALPCDDKIIKATIAARNLIPAVQRYAGMIVTVQTPSLATYILGPGLTNADWMVFTAGAVSIPLPSIGVASNIYVSNAGNDANNGDTALTPYLTIGRAFNRIEASVVGGYWIINLAAGSYTESLIMPNFLGGRRDATYGDSVVEILGDEVMPTNCVITNVATVLTVPKQNGALRIRGVHFVGGGANVGISQFGSNVYVINCSFQSFITAISCTSAGRFTWEASTAGSVLTFVGNGINLSSGSVGVILTSLTFTSHTNTCLQATSNSNINCASGITFTRTGALVNAFAQAATNGAINFGGATTYNIANIVTPFRVINTGSIIQGNGSTINLTDCTRGGQISENSYYQDGTGAGNTYNYLGTTPNTWLINSNATVFAGGSFSGANIITGDQTGVILGPWWNKQRTIVADSTLTALDCSVMCNAGAAIAVTLPLSINVGLGRNFKITDITGAAAANNITLTASGADLINGGATYPINTNYGSATVEAITGGWSVT